MDAVLPILQNSAASYVIDKLMGAATAYLQDQYNWKTNLQEELENLRRLLPQIQAVVGFAEHKLTWYEASNSALMEWLRQFRNEIDEAEEVLDELKYRELDQKFDSDKSWVSRAVDATAKRLRKSDDVLERLRTCVKNLNTSASYIGNFLTLVTQTGGISSGQIQQEIIPLTNESRITYPLPALSFRGREEEKGKIIQYLLGETAGESEIQRSENVHCLPLVAMGGMGKTALAQEVFDHFKNEKKGNEKKGHFDIKIWVCVSTDFNSLSLMKKILEYSTGRSESGPLELIPVKLKELLHSKRFLLVLDDAWNDDNRTEWEKLCAPLRYGQKGSWILLTTRLRSAANMVSKVIKGTMEPMMLPGLSKDECRSLLDEYAFAGQNPSEFPLLKIIGEEIVEKLAGIPLLAKSIGGALNSKLEADHWMSISRSEVWKMRQEPRDEFIPALTLSYVMLSPRLKRCFSYCSIFPQDYEFDKQKLACMWVAAGLIYSDGSEEDSDEVIANRCFDLLCNKSFFDVHTRNYWSSNFYGSDIAKDFYTMHDMLNGLACHVSRYECCRINNGAPSSILDYNAIRHISIFISSSNTDAQLQDLAKIVCKLKHLRTLWIEFYMVDHQTLDDFIRDACKSPRRIRVLIIESDECLESISDFVKLRFLDISSLLQPPSLSLSKSICKFYFLQVLFVFANDSILTKDANKLTNLRHLYGVKEDAFLSVAEVGKLTSLQKLCFSVGTEPGYRIDELKNMNNLHQLKIMQLSNVRSLEEADKVNLVRKKNLTRLELHYRDGMFSQKEGSSNPGLDEQKVLAALRPPPTIRELFITDYKGSRPAPWMDTSSLFWLESLELYGCTSLEELPPLWKLSCLKFLKLDGLKAIRNFGCHFSGHEQFPVLEKLVFDNFPLWEEWNGADDYKWFPHLKIFEIEECPKLKKIPDLPLSIEKLKMVNLGLEALPRSYKCSNGSRTFGGFQQLISLESLEIYDCPIIGEELPPLWKLPYLRFLKLNRMEAIKSLGCHSSDQMDIQFPVLEKLVFDNFPLWEEWNGADDYIWFPHLKSFEIKYCSKLKKIPDLPLSMEKLKMVKLGLEALPRSYKCSNGSRTFGGFQQLISLESLEIYDCPIIGEELRPLGKLPRLWFLKLNGMEAIKSLGCHSSDQMDIQFPVLEELEFNNFPLWEEWNGADDYIWFPHLKSFEIEECPKLKKIPDLPLSIEKLKMVKLGLEALPRSYKCSNGSRTFGGFQQLISLESLEIYNCPIIGEELRPLGKLPRLWFLKLNGMEAIKSLGCHSSESDQMDIQFPVLKKLVFDNFPLWEEWNGADDYIWFPHLKSFEIYNCPKLKKIVALPLSVEKLHMRNLGLEALPRSYKCSNGSRTFGGFQQLISLESLEIYECPIVGEEDDNLLPSSLKNLKLQGFLGCSKFLSVEVESQELLEDKTRKHAVSSSSVFDHSASNKAALSSSLVSLQVQMSDISQESLGRRLQGLTSLEELQLSGCDHLVSLPNIEYLHTMTALQTLDVSDCKELRELESLTALVSLRKLKIKGCPKLLATTFSTLQNPAATTEESATKIKKGTLPSLEEIVIDSILYLPNLPMSERLKILSIGNAIGSHLVPVAEFTCFPSEIEEWLLQYQKSLEHLTLKWTSHLQSLPASLECFSSLKTLQIFSAPELESLPRMPASLGELTIYCCSAELKKRCQKNIGPDWPNINHIPKVYIAEVC